MKYLAYSQACVATPVVEEVRVASTMPTVKAWLSSEACNTVGVAPTNSAKRDAAGPQLRCFMPLKSSTLVTAFLLIMPMPGKGTVYKMVMPWAFRRLSKYGLEIFHKRSAAS